MRSGVQVRRSHCRGDRATEAKDRHQTRKPYQGGDTTTNGKPADVPCVWNASALLSERLPLRPSTVDSEGRPNAEADARTDAASVIPLRRSAASSREGVAEAV